MASSACGRMAGPFMIDGNYSPEEMAGLHCQSPHRDFVAGVVVAAAVVGAATIVAGSVGRRLEGWHRLPEQGETGDPTAAQTAARSASVEEPGPSTVERQLV